MYLVCSPERLRNTRISVSGYITLYVCRRKIFFQFLLPIDFSVVNSPLFISYLIFLPARYIILKYCLELLLVAKLMELEFLYCIFNYKEYFTNVRD
jgi:hypothetical protein